MSIVGPSAVAKVLVSLEWNEMKIRGFHRGARLASVLGALGLAWLIASPACAQGLDPSRARTYPGARASKDTPRPQPKTDPTLDVRPVVPPASPSVSSGPEQTLDQIAAVVNSDIITRLELNERVDAVAKLIARQGTQIPPRNVLERQVLERMVVEKAEVQLAVEYGVRVDDLQLDRAVQRVAEQNGLSVQAFRDRLEQQGTTFASFRDDLRKQIMIERARSREIDDKVQVGEGEIDAFLAAQNGTSSDASPDVDVAQILVRVPESASPDVVATQKAKAEEAYEKAKAGGDFGQLAATYSDAPEALQGGDLGFRSIDRLPQLFVDAITPLSVGQIAAPIRSANGYHILKLVGKRGAGASAPLAGALAPVEQTHARHILIKVNEVVSAEQAKARLEDVRQRIINKTADFEDMARAYSNDASAARGGDLGTLYPGDTVPEFEKAMNALAPGEISEPVLTPFGYHLIQVVERKKQDVAQDRVRLLARQTIRDRKIDEAAEAWARELRDRAYVEMRIDDK
jgi:peptidyl-prolyl cis-trans isomerase SurA